MAGGKETPRQKMIGMIYLVLTALLALNVSKEILNSFILINNGLGITNTNFSNKNDAQMQAFKTEFGINEAKVKKYYDEAKAVEAAADSLVEHLEFLKQYLIIRTDGMDSTSIFALRKQWQEAGDADKLKYQIQLDSIFNLRNVNSKDNYDISTNIMIGGEEANPKKGPHTAMELKDKLDFFRDRMKAAVNKFKPEPSLLKAIDENFNTDTTFKVSGSEPESWMLSNFYHIPLAACITNMSKIQTDVRNAESDVIKHLFQNVSAEDFKFDMLAARVIPNSNYVLVGEKYSADVFVAAYSTTQNPRVLIGDVDTVKMEIRGGGDSSNVKVSQGVGRYEVPAGAEGLKKWGGLIQVVSPGGGIKSYPFKSEYMVAKPALVVSPTKMNVLYIGVENPVSISVPGVPTENLQCLLSGGTLRPGKEKGEFIAEVKGGSEAIVSVTAKFMVDGKASTKNMGQFKFRVKRVPDPVAYIANKKDGLVSANELIAAGAVIPKMENFDFDLQFRITSFDLSMNMQGDFITKSATGNRLSAEMASMLKSAKKGTKIYIEEVKAVGPDAVPRKLAPLNMKLQ